MLRRKFFLAAPGLLTAEAAWSQANIVPDPTPRLPPRPGQGSPADDLRFLRDAAMLSAAQADAAAPLAERAAEADTRQFAAGVTEHHRRLAQALAALAAQRNAERAAGALGAPGGRPAQALRRLENLRGATAVGGRDFLAAQMEVYPTLIEMYQTQASHTSDRELAGFAITTMNTLQEEFSTAACLGNQYGLSPPERLLGNPPQYGPGAGPRR